MNILYICSPHITDVKWMSYFSIQENNSVYMLTVKPSDIYLTESFKNLLHKKKIHLLEALEPYSLSTPINILKNVIRLNKLIRKLDIGLIHVMFSSPYALWINHVKIPSVITNRGSDILIVIPELNKSKGLKAKIHYKLTERAFKRAGIITGTSIKTVEKVRHQFNENAFLIRTGIDTESIAKTLLSDKRLPELVNKHIIFFPRSILPLYNTDLQIAAIEQLPKAIKKKYTFVFVRGMKEHKNYQNMIENKLSSIEDISYKIYKSLSQEEMWGIYNSASLTITTPKSDGTPNSALEAMAASCPLIMGSINLDDDLFGDNLFIKLKKDTAEDLCLAIVKALNSYPKEMIEAALLNVQQKANWQNEMNKLSQLYLQISGK